jgi:hypothetical protein
MLAPTSHQIVFGNLVLRSLYTAIDLDSGRVGFGQLETDDSKATVAGSRGCAMSKSEECPDDGSLTGTVAAPINERPGYMDAGQYYAPLNECVRPPTCHLSTVFELQEIESESEECTLSSSGWTALLLIIAVCGTLDFFATVTCLHYSAKIPVDARPARQNRPERT